MPDQTTTPEPVKETDSVKSVLFMGRSIDLVKPTVEQMATFRRMSRDITNLAAQDKLSGEQIFAYFERSQKLVSSLMASPEDREWLDDMFMFSQITLEKSFEIIIAATDQWASEAAPATGPVKKVAAKRARK